jgi:hypothetical protein
MNRTREARQARAGTVSFPPFTRPHPRIVHRQDSRGILRAEYSTVLGIGQADTEGSGQAPPRSEPMAAALQPHIEPATVLSLGLSQLGTQGSTLSFG